MLGTGYRKSTIAQARNQTKSNYPRPVGLEGRLTTDSRILATSTVTRLDTIYLGMQGIDTKYVSTTIQQTEVKALIDLGASNNFISKETTKCLRVKQQCIVLVTASRADGKQFRDRVLETIEPVYIRIGGHAE